MRPKYWLIIICLLIAVLMVSGVTGCKYIKNIASSTTPSPGSTTSGQPTNSTTTTSAQVWELTELEHHQVAKVIITPFTYSGTFSETSDSPGWWIFGTQGERMFKLPVGGNIAHSSPGDHWQFVGVSNAGGGYQTMARGEGTSNGQFPNATSASGTITLTTQSPLGTVSGTVNWTARRVG